MSLLPKVPSAFKGPQAAYVIELIRQLERELKRRPAVQQDGVLYLGGDTPLRLISPNGTLYELTLADNGALTVTEAGSPVTTGWQTPTLQNGWVNYGADYVPPRYRKLSNGQVEIQGLMKNGSVGESFSAFTLPVGYRPGNRLIFSTHSSAGAARFDVTATGLVKPIDGGTGYYSTNCTFFAEQ